MVKNRRIITVCIIFALVLSLSACVSNGATGGSGGAPQQSGQTQGEPAGTSASGGQSDTRQTPDDGTPASDKLKIVASIFPVYDFTRAVAGERGEVRMLLPPGAEVHSFEPTPSDITAIYGADVFVYSGPSLEPWAARILDGAPSSLTVIDACVGIDMTEPPVIAPTDVPVEPDDHDSEVDSDAHVWLNFDYAAQMADNIADGLAETSPGGGEVFRGNASALSAGLSKLDDDYRAAIEAGTRKTLVFGGRFAYAHFLEHYGLTAVSAYHSCSGEAEPSIADIAAVIDYIKKSGAPVIFYEELSTPRIALSIAEQTGATALLFSSGHSVTIDQFKAGVTFIDVMRGNLENLKLALK